MFIGIELQNTPVWLGHALWRMPGGSNGEEIISGYF